MVRLNITSNIESVDVAPHPDIRWPRQKYKSSVPDVVSSYKYGIHLSFYIQECRQGGVEGYPNFPPYMEFFSDVFNALVFNFFIHVPLELEKLEKLFWVLLCGH